MFKTRKIEFIDIISILSLAATYLCFASLRLNKTAEPLIDFGREVYIPWRISEGDVFQRDIFSIYGPLSYHFNAFLFSFAGASLETLTRTNILIGIVFVSALYVLVRKFASPLTSFFSLLFVVAVFAFGHYTEIASYNWLTPYSHEAFHGLVLSIFCLLLAYDEPESGSGTLRWLLAGFALGAVFLTKAEIFVSCSAAILAYFLLANPGYRLNQFCALIAGASIAPVLFLFRLCAHISFKDALKGVMGMWHSMLFGEKVVSNPAYIKFMALDRVGQQVGLIAIILFLLCFIFLISLLLDRVLAKSRGLHLIFSALACLSLPVLLTLNADLVALESVPRVFPFLTSVTAGFLFLLYFYRRLRGNLLSTPEIGLTVFGIFAATMTGRMFLNAHFGHYGFFILPCACIFLLVVYGELLPAKLTKTEQKPLLFPALFFSIFAALAAHHIVFANQYYQTRNFGIQGLDEVIFDYDANLYEGRSLVIARAVEQLRAVLKPGEEFLALPEGAVLNFLLKRSNATQYVSYGTEIFILGHDNMLNSVKQGRPEYVLLLSEDLGHQKIENFKVEGYGLEILNWVEANYEVSWTFGDHPLSPEGFGAILYRDIRLGAP